ncbi:MAG: hypothetical protein LUM44_19050 [Pyrinomonadaceae bacterium]|nr:hypothetical protein [Pyrinomonadaceae bacterium]
MKNFRTTLNLTSVLAVILSLTTFSVANGNSKKDTAYPKTSAKNYSVIAQNLSQKLKSELAENNLSVKLKTVEESQVTNREIVVKGEAVCILPTENTQLPLQFEAILNKSNNLLEDVKYVFVESNYAPSASEDVLMKEIMKQISKDYKTSQITIAIDGFESTKLNENQKSVKGLGEVRVGDLVWKKITFDVVMDADNRASKVDYKIE